MKSTCRYRPGLVRMRGYALLLVLIPLSLGAQRFHPPEPLPPTVQELDVYRRLGQEKEKCRVRLGQLLERGEKEYSPNEFFYLGLALGDLPGRTAPLLAGQMDNFGPRFQELLSRLVPADSLLALEARFIEINTRQAGLETAYQPPAGSLSAYAVETGEARRAEIRAYHIHPGQTIAEIGAGDESFAASLNYFHRDLTVYVNDVDTGAVLRLAYHFQHNPAFRRSENHFFAILGTALDTGLGAAKADRIIIRNAAHHFEDPESMLLSIGEGLNPEGIVFLYERFAGSCGDNCCPQLLSRDQLLDLFQRNGFRLYSEQRTGGENHWILGFTKAEG